MGLIYAIGFIAQGFFSARTLVQWFLSERQRKVVSPTIFWACSLIGSVLLFTYGWLRNDFSIILGQVLSYYIYIWNLDAKGAWVKIPLIIRTMLIALPMVTIIIFTLDTATIINKFFRNDNIPIPLVVWGSAGQVIFTLRFIYQWVYSVRIHRSVLPLGFWVISLVGSTIIISYAIYRQDPVLILGQSVGFVAYFRNIIINKKSKKHVL